MSDRIQFAVSITPIETLTTENSTDQDIIASEVGKSLGGGGDSVSLDGYEDVVATQGYADGAVGYLSVTHSAGGTQVRSGATDFIFIKNTGFKYSSASVLGAVTTDCILIVIKEVAYSAAVDGGYQTSAGTPQDHFYEIAWLQPGQGILLPCGSSNLSITSFGSNANDLSPIGQTSGNGQARVFARTFTSIGGLAASANALEFLAVD